MHKKFGLEFYCDLFSELKRSFPGLILHALGPAEVAFVSKMEKMSYFDVLKRLHDSGLDSLPGAGAEILVDRVRKIVSPVRKEWWIISIFCLKGNICLQCNVKRVTI